MAALLVARLAFAALVVLTFGAFFVAQRVKRAPSPVTSVTGQTVFSPNGDGRMETARVGFRVMRHDDVSVDVVDLGGERIRRLVEDRPWRAGRRMRVDWDGRDDARRLAPDGVYRFRVTLTGEGRSVVLPKRVAKDTVPPGPRVLSVGPEGGPAPELLPRRDGRPVRAHLLVPGRRPGVLVFRTDVAPARLVLERDLPEGTTTWTWDGTAGGGPVPSGTYLVAARSRDRAGNVGTGPAPLPPRAGYGLTLRGAGGVSVRRLAAQPPTAPVRAGGRVEVGVLTGGARYRWAVRRVGDPRPRSRGRGTRARISARAPRGRSGLYLFELRGAGRAGAVPFAVQAARRSPVLVVLPATTWQGRNPVDDDGDGLPDTLERGRPVRTARPYAFGALPPGLAEREAPLLVALDRAGRRYDLTTDVALARGVGPRLAGHRGVVLAGEARWLDAGLQRALLGYVRGGGRLLVAGPDSLRRGVRLTPTRAERPTPPTRADLFGAILRPVVREPRLVLTSTVDRIGLFAGTEGELRGLERMEETASLAPGTELVAAATTQDGEREVVVGARVGRGLVLRTGLPDLPTRLGTDPELRALLARSWTLLAGARLP
jgi:hypothetical protein